MRAPVPSVHASPPRSRCCDDQLNSPWLPLSECTMVPMGERRAIALRSADTARALSSASPSSSRRSARSRRGGSRTNSLPSRVGFGDVGQPGLIRPLSDEATLDEVVVLRRVGLAVQPALLGVRRPDPLLAAQSGDVVLPIPDGSLITAPRRATIAAANWRSSFDRPTTGHLSTPESKSAEGFPPTEPVTRTADEHFGWTPHRRCSSRPGRDIDQRRGNLCGLSSGNQ